ncbi:MAG: hypothetical protein COU63_03515 [Candidatus Pacebacteria bacterium CG10_big_fil_rev_8_21_14_0_10_36_11]|nr:adenylyltransferase/cytidyltransferase family protein [Candidatus Pacearchaeota archaeon]OIP73907.1 MAG: hypothetical protein AUK08_05115 [Candidatus Pacebacteria bacterium CG2_30_36_39]PIR64532.1 MAG: hypothetical protein COU63_03515 [Candidatus Pacebacteria bacterium CG10_big_fil_rev_8_21_14_0_10_36_11]
MALSDSEKIVLAAVAYSAQFSHPLTQEEIIKRCYKPGNISQKKLELAIEKLLKLKKLVKQNNYYTLAITPWAFRNRDQVSKKYLAIKKYKEEIISELVLLANKIPWVLGVVITGSYAAGVVQEKHDLDFLIITKKNRLWLTRLIFLFLSAIKGRRPHLPGGDISHSWDFNFWLDETRLKMTKDSKTMYEAYEALQTRWVVNKENIKTRFYQENAWIKECFPFADFSLSNSNQDLIYDEQVSSGFGNYCDWLSMMLQLKYREIRHGKQRADVHSAFLHSNHTRQQILATWKALYQLVLNKQKIVLATGVFDVLHQEHMAFLKAAKIEGTMLVVGLESDLRVKSMKGSSRPVYSEQERKRNLEQLKIADLVFVLPEEFSTPTDHLNLLKQIKPAVLAVSSHTAYLDTKKKLMSKVGGEVRVVREYNPDFSTTKLLQQ